MKKEELTKIREEMNRLILMDMNETDTLVLLVKSGFKKLAGCGSVLV